MHEHHRNVWTGFADLAAQHNVTGIGAHIRLASIPGLGQSTLIECSVDEEGRLSERSERLSLLKWTVLGGRFWMSSCHQLFTSLACFSCCDLPAVHMLRLHTCLDEAGGPRLAPAACSVGCNGDDHQLACQSDAATPWNYSSVRLISAWR